MSAIPAPASVEHLPPRLPFNLQTRLLIVIGGFVLIAGLTLGTTIFGVISRSEFEAWESRGRDAAQSAAAQVEAFNQTIIQQIQLISGLVTDRALLDTVNFAAALIAEQPAVFEVAFVDADTGAVLLDASRDEPRFTASVTDSQWFIDASTGEGEEELVDGIYSGELEAEGESIFLNVSTRLDGDMVVGMRVDMTVLSAIVQSLEFGQSGQVYVTETEGDLIAHTNLDLVREGIDLADVAIFQRAIVGELSVMTEYTNFQDNAVLGLVQPIANTDWLLFTEIDIEEARSNIRTVISTIALLILIIFFSLIVYITFIIRRDIVIRLRRLQTGAAQIEAGNLGTQVMLDRRDEIGDVMAQFNAMSSQLATRASERERLIRDLQFARRMAEENSRLKSEFLSMMSHELRTPMNAIEGFTSIMLSGMGGVEYNDKAERYLTRVNVNSKRLLQLINDFLDLSRVESGRLVLASQPFNPADLARRWQAEIGVLADNKGIGFDLVIDPALPETLYGDEEAISKVAINLLGNAIKFTEQGRVTLALEQGADEWRIVVSDTGIGIPPHAREFVFEEFRQVDQSSRRKFGGTGLGLAIVQKYTRSMGGTVTLESEVGVGSTFTVCLPLHTTPLMAKPQGTAS